MKYDIVHLLRGEAKTAHEKIIHALVQKFDAYPLYYYIPAHLTLKRAFELDESAAEKLYTAIDAFAKTHRATSYQLTGFGNFENAAVYIDVVTSAEMRRSLSDLQQSVSEATGVALDEFDREQHLHASVAVGALKPFNLREICGYVRSLEQPNFSLKFDNVTVLKKIDGVWKIDRITEIK